MLTSHAKRASSRVGGLFVTATRTKSLPVDGWVLSRTSVALAELGKSVRLPWEVQIKTRVSQSQVRPSRRADMRERRKRMPWCNAADRDWDIIPTRKRADFRMVIHCETRYRTWLKWGKDRRCLGKWAEPRRRRSVHPQPNRRHGRVKNSDTHGIG